jgi:hypothetical protein
MGLSVSGLEATSDPDWLEALLSVLAKHESGGHPFRDKVLYTNGFGFATPVGAQLFQALHRFGLARLELSRHSADADRNQNLMRFRPGVAVADNAAFEDVVARVRGRFAVRLVCVPQRGGVDDAGTLAAYLRWATSMGIRDVVFRELATIGDGYVEGSTARHHERARIAVASLRDILLAGGVGFGFRHVADRSGYYYRTTLLERGSLRVALESSCYVRMHARHRSGFVYKLVHHTNGNLCGGWNPDRDVLLRGEQRSAVNLVRVRPSHDRLDDALRVLSHLERDGVPTVLIGTAALALNAPQLLDRPPADCDVLVNQASLDGLVAGLRSTGYRVSSWGEPVQAPLDRGRLSGRFYLRASHPDGLTIDATYESPLDYEHARARAVRCRNVWVADPRDVLWLKSVRGTVCDWAVLARAGWLESSMVSAERR